MIMNKLVEGIIVPKETFNRLIERKIQVNLLSISSYDYCPVISFSEEIGNAIIEEHLPWRYNYFDLL